MMPEVVLVKTDLTTDYGKYKEKHDSCLFKIILEPRESSKERKKRKEGKGRTGKKDGRRKKKGKK